MTQGKYISVRVISPCLVITGGDGELRLIIQTTKESLARRAARCVAVGYGRLCTLRNNSRELLAMRLWS